jgi:hypothetical protein
MGLPACPAGRHKAIFNQQSIDLDGLIEPACKNW